MARVNSLWEGPPSEDGSTGKPAESSSQLSDEESWKLTKEDRLMVCACVPFPGKERNTDWEDVALSLRLAHSVP